MTQKPHMALVDFVGRCDHTTGRVHAYALSNLLEQLETYRAALETLVSATMWESEDDARSVRQIARKALASNPASEPEAL